MNLVPNDNKLTELSKTKVHHGRIDFARIGCSASDINLTEHYKCTIEELPTGD